MTASKQSEKQPVLSARWLKRHQLLILALLLSLGLHTVLLIPQQDTSLDVKTTVINARLTKEKAQGSAQQDQLPQKPQEFSQQAAAKPAAEPQAVPEPEKATQKSQKPTRQAQEPAQQSQKPAQKPAQQAAAEKSASTPQETTEPQAAIAQPQITTTKPSTVKKPVVKAKATSNKTIKPRPETEKNNDSSRPESVAQNQKSVQPQAEIKKQKKGLAEEYSDPLERNYIQQLLTHLDQKIIAPEQLSGKVRLQISINYGQIVTQVTVINSSGNRAIDDWVVKAVLAANPFPQVPDKFSQPYIFRPTIDLGSQ